MTSRNHEEEFSSEKDMRMTMSHRNMAIKGLLRVRLAMQESLRRGLVKRSFLAIDWEI